MWQVPRDSNPINLLINCVNMGVLWRSQDNLQVSVLSFHSEGPRSHVQVIKLGCKYVHSLSHVAGPRVNNKSTHTT